MNDTPVLPSTQNRGARTSQASLKRHGYDPTEFYPSGFTLIELLAVIAIIGLLFSIILVGVGKVRTSANVAKNISNLRQLGTAVRLYTMEHGHYPPAYSSTYESKLGITGKRWPDLIARNLGQYPNELLLSPTLDSRLSPDMAWQPTNYAGNPKIFARGEGIRMIPLASVQRSSAILLGDVTPKEHDTEHKNGSTDFSLIGDPNDRSNWDQAPTFYSSSEAGQPDYRNNGMAAFVFVDGHVELLAKENLLNKHFAIE